MSTPNPHALVSTQWLEENLNDQHVRIIDATYHLPHSDRDAYEEYTYRHIPGASYFPIDEIADTTVLLPHMMPDSKKFKHAVDAMGIGPESHVVVYDGNGGYMAAARVWWMFRAFGHDKVSVLDGGLLKWGREKRPLEHVEPILPPAHFTPNAREGYVCNKEQMIENVNSDHCQVVDARSEGRFAGIDHEPRPTERKGHIPGAINLPFTRLMDPSKDFTFRSTDEIKAAFNDAGIDFSKPIVTSCGSGVTACVLTLAMYMIGQEHNTVYDGSWAEWGNDKEVPIVS